MSYKHTLLRHTINTAVILSCCLAAYYLGLITTSPATRALNIENIDALSAINGLAIEPRDLALGDIWEVPNHKVTVTVRNTSNKTIAVNNIATSCDCTSVEPKTFTLPPYATIPIAVTIDLTHRQLYQIGLRKRPLSVRLDPLFAGENKSTAGWEITGNIKSLVTYNKSYIAFCDQCLKSGPVITKSFLLTAYVPIDHLIVNIKPENGLVRAARVDGNPSQFRISIAPNPNLPIGPFDCALSVTGIAPDGKRIPCPAIDVFGVMQPPARVVPDVIVIGEQALGVTIEEVITVKLPSATWKITRIECDSDSTTLTYLKNIDSFTELFSLRQLITKRGENLLGIRFIIEGPDGTAEPTVLTILYQGYLSDKPSSVNVGGNK